VIPLWLKLAYTLMVATIVPVYLVHYGAANFLWFSDIALIVTAIALWQESRLLASMMAVAVLLPELLWNVSFFARLLARVRVSGLADYMFDRTIPLWIRSLSLFHIPMPIVLVWMLHTLGYDPRALPAQTLLAWVVFPLTYAVTKPEDNINWVFGPGGPPQRRIAPRLYLVLVLILFPLIVYVPTHLLLQAIFGGR
jgi:hypothetical protein